MEGASKFANGLANNHTLTGVKLKLVHSTSDFSWQSIFTALHSSRCRLEKLDMTGNGDNTVRAISLSRMVVSLQDLLLRITQDSK